MQQKLKRYCDVFISATALVVLSPVLLVVALVIYLTMGRPVIFRHPRPGQHSDIFTLYKFRTMIDAKDADGNPLPDSARLTRAGMIIRACSLDELPQFWNVLKGDMSLIGPRPLLIEYLGRYTPFQRRRHEVKPGITGWAQVNGRNSLSWEEKFELDVWYVDNWSMWLDARIMLMTAWKILRREGIRQDGQATMEPFMGGDRN